MSAKASYIFSINLRNVTYQNITTTIVRSSKRLIFILEQSGRIFASKEEAKNFCILFWRGVLLFTVVECRLNANMLYYKICLCLPFSALSLCILLPYVLLICIILRSSQYFRESVSINHSFRHQ